MEDAVLAAVELVKASDFKATGIKVELEANMYRSRDDEDALRFVFEHVAASMDVDFEDGIEVDDDDGDYAYVYNPLPQVSYARFYNDGSVDSELTFTLKLDDPSNIFLLPKFLEAFTALGEDEGNLDVDGAGMHMALINSRSWKYPTHTAAHQLIRFNNFARSMQLMMPALYFLAAHGETTRALPFRPPRVAACNTAHGEEKYNAISYNSGAIEFRIFDTCYDTPDAILDNFVVMANTMKYWKKTYKPSGLEAVTRQIDFGTDFGRELKRFYTSTEHIQLLNRGLLRLKPSYRTITELKAERKFVVDLSYVSEIDKRVIKDADDAYEEFTDRFKRMVARSGQEIAVHYYGEAPQKDSYVTSKTIELKQYYLGKYRLSA